MRLPKYKLPIGTICFSTNLDASKNNNFGLFNHVAMIIDDDQNIIEAQENKGVIQTSWSEYSNRTYDFVGRWGVLYPLDKAIGKKAAVVAKSYIGRRYGFIASARLYTLKFNCVSVIVRSYSKATNINIKSVTVDDLIKYNTIFTDKIEKVK